MSWQKGFWPMAERKQTPDVLAQLLSAELPTTPAISAPAPALPENAPATNKVVAKTQPPRDPRPRAQPIRDSSADAWEVEIVTFQEHRGWRPRYANGAEIKGWLTAPVVHDYVNLRGADGWELAATATLPRFYGAADGLQLYFKRRK